MARPHARRAALDRAVRALPMELAVRLPRLFLTAPLRCHSLKIRLERLFDVPASSLIRVQPQNLISLSQSLH